MCALHIIIRLPGYNSTTTPVYSTCVCVYRTHTNWKKLSSSPWPPFPDDFIFDLKIAIAAPFLDYDYLHRYAYR